MAKIAYVGLPAHGHTNPSLPVVKELVDRGHEVLYYNGETFRAKVVSTGAHFMPLPSEPLPSEREISEALHQFINASLMFAQMSRPLALFMLESLAAEQPDLVIYDSAAMWGYIAARSHDIPNVCFVTTFVLDGSFRAIGLGTIARFLISGLPHLPKLLRWRRRMAEEFGKANAGGITEYAELNIVFTSAEFHPPNSFIDGRFRFVGPSLNLATRDGDFPFHLFDEGRKVYISLGTVNHLDLPFYQAVFTAFNDFPAQFILSAGRQTNLHELGTPPDNFIVQNYVPQLEILPRVNAFITHGGMNSVHEGLYFGVPEIVVPHQFEQLLNGKRVAKMGAGILLGNRTPYGRVTPEELHSSLTQLLESPDFRTNAERVGFSLREAGGYRRAATEIENYLAGFR